MNYKQKQRNNNKYRRELIKRATKEELEFKNFLTEHEIKHNFQKGFLKPYHRICDFYIKKYRLIVEIDGGYHNDTKEQDARKDQVWSRFSTLRITNDQIWDGTYKQLFWDFVNKT